MLGRRFGVVPKAAHPSVAPGDDLASHAALHGFVVFVPQLQLSEGQRWPRSIIAIGSTSVWP
jgi:hypothetical protein